jgi:hypothetical protein
MTQDELAAFRRDVQRIYFEPLDDLARRVGVMGPTERQRWRALRQLWCRYRAGDWAPSRAEGPRRSWHATGGPV